MTDIRKQVSQFIANQFPAIYREDGETLVSFITAYYEFLETNQKYSHYVNRRLDEYSDIDETLDEFVIHFKKKYLADFPYISSTDARFLIKHIIDEYRAKGSDQSLRLLMQLLFGEKVDIYYPGQDVLKPSDSRWVVPQFVEVAHSERTVTFLGKRVYSDRFNASGVVENVITKRVAGKIIDLVYMSSIEGTFHTGDTITDDGNLEDAPVVVGSLTTIDITLGGANYKLGDILKVTSPKGKDGTAKVTELAVQTNSVTFVNNDPGFGYTLDGNTIIYVANSTLFMDNSTLLPLKTNVTQHLEILYPDTISVDMIVGANVVASNTSIYGPIVSANTSSITVNPVTGTFVGETTITINSTPYTANATLTQVANTEGIVVGNGSDRIGIYRTNPQQFYAGANTNNARVTTVYGDRTVNRVGTGTGASFEIGSIDNTQDITVNTDMLYNYASIALNATDYGLLGGSPVVNSASIIAASLNYKNLTIGSIKTFKNLNPGGGYDTSIFTLIDTPSVSAYDYRDYIITINTPSRSFVLDDLVNQGNTVFGKVKSVVGNKLYVRNYTFGDTKFVANSTPIVSNRGASATMVSVLDDTTSLEMGINANISGDVRGATGTINKVTIVSSGIGYDEGDVVTLVHVPGYSQDFNNNTVEGTVHLGNGGKQGGYWETTTSHLNEVDVRIHDNKYYQQYSYDIIASISFDKYEKMLRKVMHVAGTKMFGSVAKVSEVSIPSIANTEIRTTQLVTSYLETNGSNLVSNTSYVTVQTEVEV